jgi:hypothetical protein
MSAIADKWEANRAPGFVGILPGSPGTVQKFRVFAQGTAKTSSIHSNLNVRPLNILLSTTAGMELITSIEGNSMSVTPHGFPTHLASELTGVTPRTLLNWCTRDFLKPSVSPGRTGPGGERMYSFRDLVAIRVADDLRSRGIDVRYLHSAVDYIRNREGLELDRVLPADVFLLSDGRTFREVQFGPTFGERVLGAMQFAPSGPYSMLFIPFSKFVHEIQTKARACSQSAAVTPRPYPADEERR